MSFKKKSDCSILPSDVNEKTVSVIYIYKKDVEDELDQQELFSKAFSFVNENEDYDVLCFRNDIWFGVSTKCFTCIYIDFQQDDFQNPLDAIKFIDNRKWKLNAGFIMLENVYNKIIITSTAPPTEIFKSSKKWQEKQKSFKIINL